MDITDPSAPLDFRGYRVQRENLAPQAPQGQAREPHDQQNLTSWTQGLYQFVVLMVPLDVLVPRVWVVPLEREALRE